MRTCAALAAVVAMTACGGGSPAPGPTADGGPCGSDLFFTGELVDWDSTDTTFCGILGATLQVHGDPARVDHTAPNGRIQLCLAPADTTQIDVTMPTDASPCTIPASTYAVPGIVIASRAAIASGAVVSTRAFTVARAPAFGYDGTKAQVFVHVDGTLGAVALAGTHDPAQAFDGSAWAAGATGADVYFPNVDPTPGTADVSLAGASAVSAPLVAGTFTYLTLVAE